MYVKCTHMLKRRGWKMVEQIFFSERTWPLKDRLEKNFPDRVNSTRRRRRRCRRRCRLPELYKGDLWAYCDWRKGGVSRSIDFRKWACRARFADHRLLDIYMPTRVFLFIRKGPLPLLSPYLTDRERVNWLNVSCTRFAVFYYKTKGWPWEMDSDLSREKRVIFFFFFWLLPS